MRISGCHELRIGRFPIQLFEQTGYNGQDFRFAVEVDPVNVITYFMVIAMTARKKLNNRNIFQIKEV